VLHEAHWKCRTKKSPKIRHLGNIAQLCRATSSQLRHASTIGKKLVKQQCLSHMSSQYGKLRPTNERLRSVGEFGACTPGHFKGFRVLAALLHGTLVVGVSQTAALTRWTALFVSDIILIMVALRNRADRYIFILWFLLSSFSLSFFFPRLISAVAEWMSAILAHMV